MMPSRKPLLLWTAAVIATGLLVVLAVRSLGPQEAAPAAAVAPAVPSQTAQAAQHPASTADEAAPPWMQQGSAIASATRVGNAAPSEAASPAAITQSLARIRQQSEHNTRAADELLAQIDALEKSGKAPADVRLDALRDNLLIAKQAQALAREMAESTQLPDSPQRRQRNAEIIAELQQLQGRLRYDVAATPANGRQGQ